MNEIIIKKAKIIDDLYLEVEYIETQPDVDSTTSHDFKVLYKNRVHDDLKNAYKRLIPQQEIKF